ncbi:SusC/RagA family TonB-linked outer membrane protein [Labilibacter marinus]|uniref:SusC/RagA family TonB-linked outer membrane protein n=1 Tax=Labilibacter marinus TaxID=1477105 RepID=UPI00094F7420|nr:TonB-dependent receptor [Labilibacter marinus]
MKTNLRLFTFIVMLCLTQVIVGQNRTVKGTVTDDTQEPLPGVSIRIEGTSTGTISDIDGNFNLNVPEGNVVLQFSFVGFKDQSIDVTNQSNLNVVLEFETVGIDEIVAVGYGNMKKSDISGASVSLSADKLKTAGLANIDQALQGRAAGVTTVSTSGQPGGAVSVRVRGQSTVNAGAEPLYVVDGVPISNTNTGGQDLGLGGALGNSPTSGVSALSSINPNDILSMEILKDASATAIYGSQGANGVVLITTKRGKKGDAKFHYTGSYGVQRQATSIDILNLKEFAEYSNSVSEETKGRDQRVELLDPSLLGHGTDWQEAIFQIAPIQQHQINVSGGSDKLTYMVSGGYMDQDGTVIGTEFERFTFRSNLDAQLKPWLKMGVNSSFSHTKERLGLADSEAGIIRVALQTTPDLPIYNMDGTYASVFREGQTSQPNAIGMAMDDDNLLNRSTFANTVFFDATIIKDLVLHTEGALNLNYSKGEVFRPAIQYGNWERPINNMRSQTNKNTFWQIKNYLTYKRNIGKHRGTVMVGQEMWESSYEFQSVYNTNLPSNDIKNPALGDGEPQISYGFGSSSMSSLYGRLTYNYDDRYMLTYTYRRDGSSNFGPENRWAGFHSFAGSWRLSNETFMDWAKPVLTNAKVRFGWGQVGNQSIGGYRWGSSVSRMDTGLGAGYRQSNIANPYIQWEKQEQLNLGLDFSVYSFADVVVDLYKKTSKDMLMPLQLPSYMGTRGNESSALAAPWGNYGEIENRGLEVTVVTHNLKKEFKWDTDFQISMNRNKLVALDGTPSAHIEGYGQWSDVVSLTEVGDPLFGFYGYVTDGIYQDLDDLKNSPKPDKYPNDGETFEFGGTTYVGDQKYKDISGPDGKPDGKIDSFDRTNIGSPMPDFTFGFNNTFSYKNFDLSIFINGSYGNDVMNYNAITLSSMKSIFNNQLGVVTQRARLVPIDGNYDGEWWTNVSNVKVGNSGTEIPRAVAADPNDNDRISDRYIEDGSFIRIKNITFGYTIPSRIAKKLHLSNLRAYTSIENLATFTNYTGFDPEVGASTQSSNGNVYGLDNGRYPAPQVFTFGLNVSF